MMQENETPPVLVVDADERVRALVTTLFERLGFPAVDGVGDGATALERLRGARHVLVVADLALAPTDGLALLREIRADEELSGLPVILSAQAFTGGALDEARLAGADAVILKPFELCALRDKARQVLNRRPGRRAAVTAAPSAFTLDFPLLALA